MKRILIPIAIVLVISLSYFVISQTTGQFSIGNEPPEIVAGSFEVQDGSSSWDNSDPIDTHDINPNFRWEINDPNKDALDSKICIGTAEGLCDVLPEEALGTSASGSTVTYGYTGAGITFDKATDCVSGSCSKTYYVTLSVTDPESTVSESHAITFLNNVPSTPSSLTPTTTHNQNPTLTWTATDADDGSVDKWPADTLTYSLKAGTSTGDGTYEDNAAANSAGEQIDNTIPWGTPSGNQAINTVYARITATDNLGITSENYDDTFDLVDNLPSFIDVYVSDSAITDGQASCTKFLPQNCYINPLKGDYTSVNIVLSFNDADSDCSGLTHSAEAVLCLVDSAGAEVCNELTNADYSYELNFLSVNEESCNFSISIPDSDSRGIEFFRAPGTYKLYVSADSQAGASTSWVSDYIWKYVESPTIGYTNNVYLGDRVEDGGDGIQLGIWNPGLSLETITNTGNLPLSLEWDASDPSSDGSSCTSNTATCWDLTTNDDLQIDDDTNQAADTGNLVAVSVPESPTRATFQPVSGLQVCDSMSCNSATLSETLDTYFHINPPVGLSPGTYNTNIYITYRAI